MTLVLLRHGTTKANSAGRIRAQSDPPMTPEGEQQIASAAQHFAGLPINEILASTRQRSVRSAQILAQATGSRPKIVSLPALDPWNMGNLAGQSEHAARGVLKKLYDNPDMPAPGGGESFNQSIRRYLPILLPKITSPDPHVVVSHNRTMHALEAVAAAGGKGIDMSVLKAHDEGQTKPGHVMILGADWKPRFLSPDGAPESAPSADRGGPANS